MERHGTSPIRMRTIDIGNIQQDLDTTISKKPDFIDVEFGDACTGDGRHNDQCRIGMDIGIPCFVDQALAAQGRKRRLKRLDDLTKCAVKPFQANGKGTLEGMAIDSCIYTFG